MAIISFGHYYELWEKKNNIAAQKTIRNVIIYLWTSRLLSPPPAHRLFSGDNDNNQNLNLILIKPLHRTKIILWISIIC